MLDSPTMGAFSVLVGISAVESVNLDSSVKVAVSNKKLLEVFQSQYARLILTERFEALVEENQKVAVRAANFSVGTDEVSDAETIELSVSAENLEDLFEAAGRKVSEGLHKAWWRWRVPEEATPEEKTKAKVEFVALCFVEDDVALKLEGEAQKLVQYWLNTSKTDIGKLPDGRMQEYDEIRRLGSEPEERVLTYPHVIEGKKADHSWQKHLYVDEKEGFPQKFNMWETKVLEAELDKEVVLGWVRNPDRKPWSLRVPYRFRGEPPALTLRPDVIQIMIFRTKR